MCNVVFTVSHISIYTQTVSQQNILSSVDRRCNQYLNSSSSNAHLLHVCILVTSVHHSQALKPRICSSFSKHENSKADGSVCLQNSTESQLLIKCHIKIKSHIFNVSVKHGKKYTAQFSYVLL